MRGRLVGAVLALVLLALGATAGDVGAIAPSVPFPWWPTYHRDLARTGAEAASPADRPDGPWRRVWSSPALDGQVYAEPLVVGDRVYAATQNNSVFALDARSGRIVWAAHLGVPVPRSQLPCGNVDPTGVLSTPVIDPEKALLHVVAFVMPGRHELVTLDLASGGFVRRRVVDAPGVDPLVHQQRGALTLSRGVVYVPYGGLAGDCGDYRGTIVGAPADGRGELRVYRVPASRQAGIWAPGGPSVNAAGDLLVTTGNSASPASFDFGDSVLRLSPDLVQQDFFSPLQWPALNVLDLDLGSLSPAVLEDAGHAGGGLVFQIGKDGVGYLLRADQLGGIGGQAFWSPVCAGAFGSTAWQPPLLFVPCQDGVAALRIEPQAPSFSLAWRSLSFAAGPPIVAGGVVWALDLRGGRLLAFDLESGRRVFEEGVGVPAQFSTPAAGGGRVFVAAERRIIAFASG